MKLEKFLKLTKNEEEKVERGKKLFLFLKLPRNKKEKPIKEQ